MTPEEVGCFAEKGSITPTTTIAATITTASRATGGGGEKVAAQGLSPGPSIWCSAVTGVEVVMGWLSGPMAGAAPRDFMDGTPWL